MSTWRWNVTKYALSALFALLLLISVSMLFGSHDLVLSRLCASSVLGNLGDNICSSSTSSHNFSISGGTAEMTNSSDSDVAHSNASGHLLGLASSTYVLSLPKRIDRRVKMEKLREALKLNWTYFDALDKEDPLIDKIMSFVRKQRDTANRTFGWPDSARNITSVLSDTSNLFEVIRLQHDFDVASHEVPHSNPPLLCAIDDNTIPSYANASPIPFHLVLSRGMIACWYSHLRLIAHVVKTTQHIQPETWNGKDGVAIVLEDDIDVEWGLKERLARMWSDLPENWDIVMLGHCWSDESFHPPVTPGSQLHPSNKPKCTHGYVLSPFGARALLSHLTYPPFAFSRAIDQAIVHLIQSKRINSYSVVPSIVVQQRFLVEDDEGQTGDSDIWIQKGRTGSKWKDTLVDSAFARILRTEGEDIFP